jgi:hypothetical protein
MTQAPPDDGFGRAVRLASDRASREGDDCPSPDDLAAFADGALFGDEQSAVVLHLSACARCQDIVSAVVRMSAAVDVPEAPQRRPVGELVAFPAPPGRRIWRWVAPVAAATAAVLAWVVVSPVEPRRSPAVVEDASTARKEAPSVGGVPGTAVGAAEAEPSPSPPGPPAGGRGRQGTTNERSSPALPSRGRAVLDESPNSLSAVASVPDAAVAPVKEEDTTRQAASAGLLPAAAGAQLTDAMAKQRAVEDAPPAAPSPTASTENRMAASPERSRRAVAEGVAATTPPRAPSAGRRWRVAPGAFEESGDEGRTWRAFPLPAGARVTVAEFAAPDVWWLAGPAGLVLRIEGSRVFEAAGPSSSDITELGVASARGAVVGTADGNRYETRDEGRTWRPLPSRE